MNNLKQKQKESTPVGGMTYEEIGKVLGISKQGVRRIEKRAIRKIKRKILAEFGFNINKVRDFLIYTPEDQY